MRFNLMDVVTSCIVTLVMVLILLPAVEAARSAARKESCQQNLRQMGIALHEYHDSYQVMPANGNFFWQRQSHSNFTWSKISRGSMLVRLLPYIQQRPVYNQLNFHLVGKEGQFGSQLVDGKPARNVVIPTFLCPSQPLDPLMKGKAGGAISTYGASIGSQSMPSRGNWCNAYPGNVFGTGQVAHANDVRGFRLSGVFGRGFWAAKFRDMVDGQSQIIAMGEIRPNMGDHHSLGWMNSNSIWTATTAPLNYPIVGIDDPQQKTSPQDCSHFQNWQTSQGFKSTHQGGAMFVFGDGSVRFVLESIDYMTYQRLGDRRDGEPIKFTPR